MDSINIFNTPLFINLVKNKEFDEEIKKELLIEEKKNKTAFKSNVGGFQTENIRNPLIEDVIIKNTFSMLNSRYTSLSPILIKIANFWINKNYKSNWNKPHTHPQSHYSGVYYLDVPENSGNLTFIRNNDYSLVKPDLKAFDHQDFLDHFNVIPKKNMMILFPSNVLHMVSPNMSDLPRISLAFNIGLFDG